MNNNSWFKKEMPLQTVIGFGGGATGFGAYSSSASKPYVDDVFSIYPYVGSGGSKTITNGIDFSTKGGLLWFKNRTDSSTQNILTDTARGVDKVLYSDANNGETASTINQSFNDNGWTMSNSYGDMNQSTKSYSSWSFAKQKGFFDIATWTGNSSYDQTISHNLGCEPGCIMYKSVSASGSWYVYHRGTTKDKFTSLNSTDAAVSFSDTLTVTSTQFVAPGELGANTNGETYVAYLFAGGESTASEAVSVDFDGSGDYLEIDTSSDFAFGTGDYTIEFWMYKDSSGQANIYEGRDGGNTNRVLFYVNSSNKLSTYINSSQNNSSTTILPGQWYHCALSREGSTNRMFLNGTLENSWTDNVDVDAPSGHFWVGHDPYNSPAKDFDGHISNFRVVKGTALYTSTFKPSTEPLTNITNTKLLCCNDSSVTGSTVTPNTITTGGSPTASSDSPFDDTAAFIFGENQDQGIIKTGKYIGNGSTDGPEVYVGWEPQWLLIRNSGGGDWNIVDCMRGINNASNDNRLWANLTGAESTSLDVVDITPTGFKIKHDGGSFNGTGTDGMIYIAIRRPDGYVGKLPSAGTGAFAIDSWVSDSTPSNEPNMLSDFPVDFVIDTDPTHALSSWNGDRFVRTRQISAVSMKANNTDNEASATWGYFDYGTGWMNRQGYTGYSNWTSWMWKRGQGMDVVCYKGDGSYGRTIPHSLNQVPEMMWVKQRAVNGEEWMVYHKGLDGGNQPETHYIMLHSDAAEVDGNGTWNDTAPTSTHFTLGGWNSVNYSGQPQVAYLFASANDADGNPISKVGSYTGDGGSGDTGQVITTGFAPRLVMIKRASGTGNWYILDTFRGWTSSNNIRMKLNVNAAQDTDGSNIFVVPLSTGFKVNVETSEWNANGSEYIYYAHA